MVILFVLTFSDKGPYLHWGLVGHMQILRRPILQHLFLLMYQVPKQLTRCRTKYGSILLRSWQKA